jgi:LDH2 family malate/lactate/ureidoglycolate dehydrogenase
LLPLGYKGYGLAVIGEIFSGILSGARILDEIPLWFAEPDIPIGNGHFHMAIDISRFCAVETFKTRVDQMAKILKATPLMEGFQEILMPGEPEARKAEAQSQAGIAIPDPVIRDLVSMAENLDVEVPESFTRPAE